MNSFRNRENLIFADRLFKRMEKSSPPDYDKINDKTQLHGILENGLSRPVLISQYSNLGMAVQSRREISIPTPKDFFCDRAKQHQRENRSSRYETNLQKHESDDFCRRAEGAK